MCSQSEISAQAGKVTSESVSNAWMGKGTSSSTRQENRFKACGGPDWGFILWALRSYQCFQAEQWQQRSWTSGSTTLTEHATGDSWKSSLAAVSPSSPTSTRTWLCSRQRLASAVLYTSQYWHACGDPHAVTSAPARLQYADSPTVVQAGLKVHFSLIGTGPRKFTETVLLNSAFPLH